MADTPPIPQGMQYTQGMVRCIMYLVPGTMATTDTGTQIIGGETQILTMQTYIVPLASPSHSHALPVQQAPGVH